MITIGTAFSSRSIGVTTVSSVIWGACALPGAVGLLIGGFVSGAVHGTAHYGGVEGPVMFGVSFAVNALIWTGVFWFVEVVVDRLSSR
jgi:hypothetical protein